MKTGVIGVGVMGINHARVYSEISDLVGVFDADPARGKEVAKRFGVKYFPTTSGLLDKADALTIAVPTVFHHKLALEAIRKGRHILIEKPITRNIEEGKEIIKAAEKEGITLSVGQIERHNPVVGYMKNALTGKRYGEIVTMVSRRVSKMPERIRDVGVVLDLAIHDIDVMRYLSGSEIVSVYALGGGVSGTTRESHAGIMLEFSSGITGFIETNWLTPMKVRKLYITTNTHYLEMDYMGQAVRQSTSSYIHLDESNLYQTGLELDVREIKLKKQEPLKNELSNFLNAAENGGKPLVTGVDGLKALEAAEAALLSMKDGKKVILE